MEGPAPQVVGSLLLLGEFASPVDNQNTSGTDRCRGDDRDRWCSCSMSTHRIRSRQLALDFHVRNYMSRILLDLSLYGPPKFWDQSAVVEFCGHPAPHESCIARFSSWAHCWLSSHSLQRAMHGSKDFILGIVNVRVVLDARMNPTLSHYNECPRLCDMFRSFR